MRKFNFILSTCLLMAFTGANAPANPDSREQEARWERDQQQRRNRGIERDRRADRPLQESPSVVQQQPARRYEFPTPADAPNDQIAKLKKIAGPAILGVVPQILHSELSAGLPRNLPLESVEAKLAWTGSSHSGPFWEIAAKAKFQGGTQLNIRQRYYYWDKSHYESVVVDLDEYRDVSRRDGLGNILSRAYEVDLVFGMTDSTSDGEGPITWFVAPDRPAGARKDRKLESLTLLQPDGFEVAAVKFRQRWRILVEVNGATDAISASLVR